MQSEKHSNNGIIDGNDEPENNTQSEQKYPKAVLFIIGNEFCERFTFYGMISKLIKH